MQGLVLVNSQVCEIDKAHIPAFDRGFLYGDAVYEIIAAIGRRPIDLSAHLCRLRQSASSVGIPIPWTDEFLKFEIDHLLGLMATKYASIRLVVTRGVGDSLLPKGPLAPARYIYCLPLAEPSPLIEERKVKLNLRRRPQHQAGEHIKSNSFLPTIAASLDAKTHGFDDVLWTNPDGEITEAGSANIFLISREGDLVEIATPPPSAGLLVGITRNRIIELLTRAKIPVTERTISVEELPRFDEGFLSSSLRGLYPIEQIDQHRLYTCRPQAVFRHIMRLYDAWLLSEQAPGMESASKQ